MQLVDFAEAAGTKLQCVVQFPDGTSFRPKKVNSVILSGILTLRPLEQSTGAIRRLMVLAPFLVEKQADKKGFCLGE